MVLLLQFKMNIVYFLDASGFWMFRFKRV